MLHFLDTYQGQHWHPLALKLGCAGLILLFLGLIGLSVLGKWSKSLSFRIFPHKLMSSSYHFTSWRLGGRSMTLNATGQHSLSIVHYRNFTSFPCFSIFLRNMGCVICVSRTTEEYVTSVTKMWKNQGNQKVPIFSLLHTSTFSCDGSDWRSANSGVTVITHTLTCQSDHMQPQSCHVFCAFLVHISFLHACLNPVWWFFFSVHMLRFFAITWFSEVRNIVLSSA